ncbi:3-isopropylmalate dehydratase [Roseovarius sp. HI0049]|nr:3-isopropylmalate dehydratase [Roseovarius sp. HI0049]KZY48105.1 3-isopropylmalate dehydratase [Roseovarius sp. HI0049]
MMEAYKGTCWKLPDGVSSDQLIGPSHVFDFEAETLRKHLLEEVDPRIAAEAKPGDVLVAGRNFAQGSNHSHPFIAMKAMGLGLLCRSISRGPYRLTIFMGVPILTITEEIYTALEHRSRIEVDFTTGDIKALDMGAEFHAEALPLHLLEIVTAGGGFEHAKAQEQEQNPQ